MAIWINLHIRVARRILIEFQNQARIAGRQRRNRIANTHGTSWLFR
jgi:hypothetical protein